MTSTYRLPAPPPSAADLIKAWTSTSPSHFHQAVLADPEGGGQLYRAIAGMFAYLAERTYKAQQARYHIPHSTAGGASAQGWQYSRTTITVRRNKELNDARTVEAGAMELTAIGGRTYRNEFVSEWAAGDVEKTIVFRCDFPGSVGDLDFAAAPNGKLADEDGAPDFYFINHTDLSRGRASPSASLVAPLQLSGRTVIRDSGVPDQFIATDEKLYVRIIGAANAENVGRTLRILDFRSPGVELPVSSDLYPHLITVDDGPLSTVLTSCRQDDGGVFTDYTAQAASDAADDVLVLPASPAVGDAAYFGAGQRFGFITIDVTTAGVGVWTVVWEYWDGGAWVSFPAACGLVDGTQGFTVVGELVVTVSALPTDWASTVVDGVAAFYWRARVDFSLGCLTQAAAATVRAWVPQLLTATGEDGTIAWAILDWKDQGFDLVDIPAPTGGVDEQQQDVGVLADHRIRRDGGRRWGLSRLVDRQGLQGRGALSWRRRGVVGESSEDVEAVAHGRGETPMPT